MSVLVVTAVEAEAAAVVRRLGPTTARVIGPYRSAGRVLGPNYDLTVIPAGVGEAVAAAATATALALDPTIELVINAGIAGGFAPRIAVGEVVIANRVVAADLGAEEPGSPGTRIPLSVMGYVGGTLDCDPERVADAAARTGAHVGTILTVSTVTASDQRIRDFVASHPEALAEAMEGHGVGVAAAAHSVPFLEIRSISNPVGIRDPKHWSIDEALDSLSDAIPLLLAP